MPTLNQRYQQLNAGQRSLIRKELQRSVPNGVPITSTTAGRFRLKRARQLARRYGVSAATIQTVWMDGPAREAAR